MPAAIQRNEGKTPEGDALGTPDETSVWIGLVIGKTEHVADVFGEVGSPLAASAVANDEAEIEAILARPESFGSPAPVVDQPGSQARLVHGVGAGNDELLEQLRVLNGYDIDLAVDATRLIIRLGDALQVSRRPRSAQWIPSSTMQRNGSCWPGTQYRGRCPRQVAATSRGRFGNARRASRRRSLMPSASRSRFRPSTRPARWR